MVVKDTDGTYMDAVYPPDWMEDGEPEDVEGVLQFLDVKAPMFGQPFTSYMVDGQSVDPTTIKPL
jgi:hypothetical protein